MGLSKVVVGAVVAVLLAAKLSGWTDERPHDLAVTSGAGSPLSPAYRGLSVAGEGEYVQSSERLWLHYRRWRPAASPPRGVVFIAHGITLHSKWYEEFALKLNAEGYEVVAADHQGWGLSEGDRGYAASFSRFSDDFALVAVRVLADLPAGTPSFCLGLSMGAVVAVEAAAAVPSVCANGLVLVAAALETRAAPAPLAPLLRVASAVLPKLPLVSMRFDPAEHYGDGELARAVAADALLHYAPIRARFAQTFLESQAHARALVASAADIAAPMVGLHGAADTVAAPRAVAEALRARGGEYIEYAGAGHGIFHNPRLAAQTHKDIVDWINRHVAVKH
eukprot:m51a1_g10753 putative monoglyceride lipase (336) ;mRNA; r:379094-380344